MKHLILGTAGHIDHGKTSLVNALTGINCDTHKEEKRRGITINLGFANLKMPNGEKVGIIDVPGHRDFIHTMVAGASGIDIAMLVVAADGGVMPQTREHLRIMETLGIKRGIIVLTRIDITEKDIIEMASDEISEFVKGSFLENAPIVRVSSKTREGIDLLTETITAIAAQTDARPEKEIFRMYIDRIFSVSGFGTVVTGSVLSGKLTEGEQAYLLPDEKELRIRRIERYGAEEKEVVAGDRASLNVVGLSKEDFVRGMLISDRKLRNSNLLDAKLQLFDNGRNLGLWTQAQFLMGTFETQVRVHLLDKDILHSGQEALVQIHCPISCTAQMGDHFVLRSSSNDMTLGGGEIIDPAPLHHKRRHAKDIQSVAKLADGKLVELVASEVRKNHRGISADLLADALNISIKELLDISKDLPPDIAQLKSDKTSFFIEKKEANLIEEQIHKNIANFHKRNPLTPDGRTIEELQGILGVNWGAESGEMLQLMLNSQVDKKKLKKVNHTWADFNHSVENVHTLDTQIAVIETYLKNSGLRTPLMTEIETLARKEGIDTSMLKQILKHLITKKNVHQIEGNYIHESVVAPCRVKIVAALQQNPDGLTVAQFRDLIDGNRKICLLLYSLFDSEGITERMGDVRVLKMK
jgi:selenocysteine-specific elongation factor